MRFPLGETVRPKQQFTVIFRDEEDSEFVSTPTTRLFLILENGQLFDLAACDEGLKVRSSGPSSAIWIANKDAEWGGLILVEEEHDSLREGQQMAALEVVSPKAQGPAITLQDELKQWDLLSDEALLNFEKNLEG